MLYSRLIDKIKLSHFVKNIYRNIGQKYFIGTSKMLRNNMVRHRVKPLAFLGQPPPQASGCYASKKREKQKYNSILSEQ